MHIPLPAAELESCFVLQVDETIGFADDEDPSAGLVSDRRDEGLYLEDLEKDSAVMAEGLPKASTKLPLNPKGKSLRTIPLVTE